ncbi:hypothetical protein [Streptomyces sp. NPDC004291]
MITLRPPNTTLVNSALLYRHWYGKVDLFNTVCSRFVAEIVETIQPQSAGQGVEGVIGEQYVAATRDARSRSPGYSLL